MSLSTYYLNQRISALQTELNALQSGGLPTSSNLATVLTNGNSAGTTDINMNLQDILAVDNINLVTINGAAYPPVIAAGNLQAVLTAGNTADIGFNLTDTVGTDTTSIDAGIISTKGSLTCEHISSSFTTSTEINAQSAAVEYLGSVADTGTSLTTKRFLLSNGSVFNRDRATNGEGITVTSDELTDYTLNVSSTKTFDNGTILNTLTQTVSPTLVSQSNLFKTTGVDESLSAMNSQSGNANFACSYQTAVANIANIGSMEVTTGGATCSVQATSILSGQSQLLRMETGLVGDALLEHLVPSGTNNLKIQSTNNLLLQSTTLNATATNLSMTSASAGGGAVPLLTLTNTNATGQVALEAYKNKPTAGVNGDVLFQQSVYGKDSGNAKQEFTRITHTIRDATAGAEDGSIELGTFVNGAFANFLQINGNQNEVNLLKPLDMDGHTIRTTSGNLPIETTSSSGTGDINATAKRTINMNAGTTGDINGTTTNGNISFTANVPSGGTNGFCSMTADRGVALTSAIGGSDGNIILDVNNIGDLQLEGTTLISPTSGGSSGQHLRIKLNGTYYKISLLND
jgi:hypothetical protein